MKSVFNADSTDCRFQFDDETTTGMHKIKAHRKLLAALSPVFAGMFNSDWAGKLEAIPITDVAYEDFHAFLNYFYKAEVQLNTQNVGAIFRLAYKYHIEDLMGSCSTFMSNQLCVDNVIEFYGVAIQFDLRNLKDKCIEFITNHTAYVLTSNAFIQCNIVVLKDILESVELYLNAETIFDVCVEWAKYKCQQKNINPSPENLRIELGDCFGLINFHAMGVTGFAKRYKSLKGMFARDESDDILLRFAIAK